MMPVIAFVVLMAALYLFEYRRMPLYEAGAREVAVFSVLMAVAVILGVVAILQPEPGSGLVRILKRALE